MSTGTNGYKHVTESSAVLYLVNRLGSGKIHSKLIHETIDIIDERTGIPFSLDIKYGPPPGVGIPFGRISCYDGNDRGKNIFLIAGGTPLERAIDSAWDTRGPFDGQELYERILVITSTYCLHVIEAKSPKNGGRDHFLSVAVPKENLLAGIQRVSEGEIILQQAIAEHLPKTNG